MSPASRRPPPRLSWPGVCLLIAASGALADDGWGRLFYSAAERARIDAARNAAPAGGRYHGLIRRADGQSTHWVDDEARPGAPAGAPPPGGDLLAGGRILVHPPARDAGLSKDEAAQKAKR
jgi:hypothetical protein